MKDDHPRNALRPGHVLMWYRIERVLGQGGFGITYLARDTNLDSDVAIKEYLPADLAVRDTDHSVHPASRTHGERYQWGLTRFIEEARTLARFKHPGIVRVLSVFEANHTAYMVMEYERGPNLQSVLDRCKTLDEAELVAILRPLMDGLEAIHAEGFIHRDIKPANIVLRQDGTPVLLDFGSARQSLGEQTRTLTSVITPGYAPFEQYYSKSDRQGPWSDIYALGATVYRAISGRKPLEAIDRSEAILRAERDIFVPASQLGRGRYSERFLAAIDASMRFREAERPQTVAEWRAMFGFDAAPRKTSSPLPVPDADDDRTFANLSPHSRPRSAVRPAAAASRAAPAKTRTRTPLLVVSLAGVALLAAGGAALVMMGRPMPWSMTAVPAPAGAPIEAATPATAGANDAAVSTSTGSAADALPEAAAVPVTEPAATALAADTPSAPAAREVQRDAAGAPADTEPVVTRAAEASAETVAEAPEPPVAEPDPAAEAARAEAERKAQVARLLAAARDDMKANRLTAPANNNALARYRKVLDIEADNPAARAGIDAVVGRYIELADRAIAESDFEIARTYLENARAISPADTRVKRVSDALTERRERADKLASTMRGLEENSQEAHERQLRALAELERLNQGAVPAAGRAGASPATDATRAAPGASAPAAASPAPAAVAPPAQAPAAAATVRPIVLQFDGFEKALEGLGVAADDVRSRFEKRLARSGYRPVAAAAALRDPEARLLLVYLRTNVSDSMRVNSYVCSLQLSADLSTTGSSGRLSGARSLWTKGEHGALALTDVDRINNVLDGLLEQLLAASPPI
ncbi:MAG: protein kinase [Gammaproteobacteria bacterium]